MLTYRIFPAIGMVVLLGGCASILTDDTTPVNVGTSNGKKVPIKIDGVVYQAPTVVNVKKSDKDKMIMASSKSGCARQTVLKRKVEDVFWVNILSGGVLGSTTDYATDKMWSYEDSVIISCR